MPDTADALATAASKDAHAGCEEQVARLPVVTALQLVLYLPGRAGDLVEGRHAKIIPEEGVLFELSLHAGKRSAGQVAGRGEGDDKRVEVGFNERGVEDVRGRDKRALCAAAEANHLKRVDSVVF